MSIKNNTTSLQSLLEQVNALPEAENLDAELSTQTELISEQDAKIAELANILAGKAGGGSSGDGYAEADALVTRTMSEYTNSRISSIGSYAFYRCSSLTTVSFPVCTTIGSSAFYGCSNLTSVSFPNCTNISNNAFVDCSKLTSANFPMCTSIGINVFYYCHNLTTASFPACTNIGSDAFNNCHNLTSVSFPVCTSIGSNAFHYCSRLTSVSFPKCTTIGSGAFNDCNNLTSANFPVCTNISGKYAFIRCYILSQVYLTGSSVCTLSNSNAFSSTPYAGYKTSFSGTPYIYVPSSLLTSYKTATNWTYFSSYFSAIEGDYAGQ